MEITEALQAMKGKDTFTDVLIDTAEKSHNNLNEFVAYQVSQYNEPELKHDKENSNKSRMDKTFTKEVMKVLVDYDEKGNVIKCPHCKSDDVSDIEGIMWCSGCDSTY
jgi:predicted CopG family antitoxin